MKILLILVAVVLVAVVVTLLWRGRSNRTLASKLRYPLYVADFGGCGGPVPEADALRLAREAARGTGIPLVLCDGSVEPGAWGDGKHDDSEAIRNAIDLSVDGGGVVRFPQGTYGTGNKHE